MAGKNYIDFSCLVQALERTDSNTVAADAVGTVIARFDLCEAWAGLTIYARFEHANIATPFDVKLDTDSCAVVPWEVLQPFGFHVSLFGDDANGERLTAAAVFVDVESTVSLADHEPIPSTPTLLQQLEQSIAQATEVAQSVRNDADAGVFDGNVVEFGSITATVGENVGTPSVEVYVSGTSTVKDVEFFFDGLKGEELPEGGAEGEALIKTAEGEEWGVVSVQGGGTGATNAQEARDNLDAAATQHEHDASDINAGTLAAERLPVIAVEGGGTGAETAAAALTNLGAAAAEHEHGADDITSGILPISRGGLGAGTAAGGRTNLGINNAETKTLLWENASDNSSFPAQTLSLDLTPYDKIEIETRRMAGSGVRNISLCPVNIEGAYEAPIFATHADSSLEHYIRYFSLPANKKSVTIGSGKYAYGSSLSNNNNYLIPSKIYGIKVVA